MLVEVSDIIVPFLLMLLIIVYLIYTRGAFEKELKESVASEFESWKEYEKSKELKSSALESSSFIGFITKSGDDIKILSFDKDINLKLKDAKISLIKEG
jgi:hypothetical protein